MKKYILSCIIVVFLFSACDKDSDPIIINQTDDQQLSDFYGNFLLVAQNTSLQTDLNEDGIFSTNQMDETDCFNNTILNLNSDYTFTINPHRIEINGADLVCNTRPITSGTWNKINNVVKLNYTLGGNNYDEELILSVDGNTLTEFVQGVFIVSTSSSGNPVNNVASDIEAIFERQM